MAGAPACRRANDVKEEQKKPSTSQGHMPTLHCRYGLARHIQPERYMQFWLKLVGNIDKKYFYNVLL
jgi:hypothetical protein